jgi:hypothetical protein
VLAFLWAARWPLRARSLYEWDSAQYALGILRFDIHEHRPHPPGYPLWIALLKAVHLFVPDLNTAQIALDFVVTSLAAVLFYRLARRLYGDAAGLLAAALLLFSPTVAFYSEVASTYPADLFISTALGGLSAELWSRRERAPRWVGALAVFAIALLAGVRQSGAVLMGPLVCASLLRVYARDPKRVALDVTLAVATVAAWYVPVARMNGGITEYRAYATATILGYFHNTSFLFGAPLPAHLEMLRSNAVWAAAGVAPAVMTAALVWTVGRLASPGELREAGRAQLGAWFFLLWIAPNALYVTLLHAIKPGYFLLDLPPLMLLAARAAAPGLRRTQRRWPGAGPAIPSAVACVVGLVSAAMSHARTGGVLDRMTLASVRDADGDTQAIEKLVSSSSHPLATMVFVLSSGPFGPTIRSLAVHLPGIRVASLSTDGQSGLLRQYSHYEFCDDYGPTQVLPPDVRRILWVHVRGAALLGPLLASFPSTHVVYYGQTIKVLESELGDEELDTDLGLDRLYHLVRAAAPGKEPEPGCALGTGFIKPASPGDLLWGGGPRSELLIDTRAPTEAHLSLHVADSPAIGQEVSVTLNGAAFSVVRPQSGSEIALDFAAGRGRTRLGFEYSRYNHHLAEFAPLDPRPFAVAFRHIECAWSGEVRTVFSL